MPTRPVTFNRKDDEEDVGNCAPRGHYGGYHGGARGGVYGKHEHDDGKGTKTTHGYYYGCHDYNDCDDYWTWGIFCCGLFFFLILLMPLFFLVPYNGSCGGYGYGGCGCNGGYGYFTLDADDDCGCNSHKTPCLSAQLFSGDEVALMHRGAIPDRNGKCSPGEELWRPPNTNELPRCVLELREGNGSHPAMVDPAVSACDNFYQHASGKWLAGAPRDVGRFFGDAAATASQIQNTIDTVEMARTWEHDRLGAMMGSCLSTYAAPDFVAEEGAFAYASKIASSFVVEDGRFNFAKAVGEMSKRGLVSPLYVDVQRAPDRDNAWIVMVDAGTTFTTDYDIETRKSIVDAVMRREGYADTVVRVEDAIEKALQSGQNFDENDEEGFFGYMEKADGFTSHVFLGRELDAAFAGWSWSDLHEAIGQPQLARTRHWVRSPEVVRALAHLDVKPTELTLYFEFAVLVQMFEFLPATYGFVPVEAEIEEISLDVHHIGLRHEHVMPWSAVRRPAWHRTAIAVEADGEGETSLSILAQRIEPRDMPQLRFASRCARQQKIFMADERNEAFSNVALKSKEKTRVTSIVNEIVEARKSMIRNAGEISDKGKAAILEKLSAIKVRVGNAPRRIRGAVNAETPYWRNIANIREMDAAMRYGQIKQDADATRGLAPFLMPTNAINAYYDPTDNTISVLSGITLYPFFSPVYNDATLFATLGAIVGHEIGHATDAFGIRFDKAGALTKWLPEEDGKVFEESNACFALQYSGLAPETHQFASGKQTVTEAAADNVGVRAALEALKSVQGVDELAPEDVAEFGLQFAQMWAVHQSRQSENNQVSYDPHPVATFRVNNAFANTPELLELYGCGVEPVCKLAA